MSITLHKEAKNPKVLEAYIIEESIKNRKRGVGMLRQEFYIELQKGGEVIGAFNTFINQRGKFQYDYSVKNGGGERVIDYPEQESGESTFEAVIERMVGSYGVEGIKAIYNVAETPLVAISSQIAILEKLQVNADVLGKSFS